MARKKTNFDISALKNNASFANYIDRLTELSLSLFEWENLPDTVDARFLELTLFSKGQAAFFEDPDIGFLCLPCIATYPLSVYGIPLGRRAYAINGYQMELSDENSVLIYNNMIHTSPEEIVQLFAFRLWDLDQIIQVNAKAQKTPVLVQGSETQRLTLKNLYKEYDGNSPVIFGDKNLDLNALKVLKTDAPYVADRIYQLKNQIWNEALTYLGISNLNAKKERMITDEAKSAQGGTIASRFSRLYERQAACEKINSMFDLDISVKIRDEVEPYAFDLPEVSAEDE